MTVALALSGCSFFDSGGWFQKPLDVFGSKSGYTYSSLNDARQHERPITANDLVDANGACPAAAATPPPASPPQPTATNPDGSAVNPADIATMLGGGIAIGMTECNVVDRLGRANAINIGRNPNGLRSVILTFDVGARPGVYRFEAGRLVEMDELPTPPAPPEPTKKKIAKKKPATTKEIPKPENKS